MTNLAKRIRIARERAKLTQKELADVFGFKPQTVSAWERGEENRTKPNAPSHETLAKIASITGVSLKWLLTGVEDKVTDVTIPSTDQVAGRIVPSVEWDKIPQFIDGDPSMSEGHARSHFPCGPHSFRTFVRDKSNFPDLEPGDSLIIDPEQGPAPGDYCLVVVNKELMLRKYRPRRDNIELAPYNSDFDTEVVPRDEIEIVGTMTESVRPRRA